MVSHSTSSIFQLEIYLLKIVKVSRYAAYSSTKSHQKSLEKLNHGIKSSFDFPRCKKGKKVLFPSKVSFLIFFICIIHLENMLCDHMNNFSHIAYLCCAVSEERLLEIIQASNTEQHRKSETQKTTTYQYFQKTADSLNNSTLTGQIGYYIDTLSHRVGQQVFFTLL